MLGYISSNIQTRSIIHCIVIISMLWTSTYLEMIAYGFVLKHNIVYNFLRNYFLLFSFYLRIFGLSTKKTVYIVFFFTSLFFVSTKIPENVLLHEHQPFVHVSIWKPR